MTMRSGRALNGGEMSCLKRMVGYCPWCIYFQLGRGGTDERVGCYMACPRRCPPSNRPCSLRLRSWLPTTCSTASTSTPAASPYFQVEYTEDKLQKYIHEDDDTLPLKLGDGTVSCDSRFMFGTDKRATITTNWSWFCNHANIKEGDIYAFHFKRKEGRHLSLTVHRL